MPYASIYDADSRLMELSGWLASYADPAIRDRLRPLPLGAVGAPWEDPELAARAAEEAIALGCGVILVASVPSRDRSPSHPDYDRFWSVLQDARVPFMLHIGGGGRPLRCAFHENGLPPTTDFLGGGENIRSKDYMVVHQPPEAFLSWSASTRATSPICFRPEQARRPLGRRARSEPEASGVERTRRLCGCGRRPPRRSRAS
ncbi:MAG: amidohydrolase family protein [Myxococcota bacterium]|nr:amidohydrolase family protein [Myxococcota bacterium]